MNGLEQFVTKSYDKTSVKQRNKKMATGKPKAKVTLPNRSMQPGPSALVRRPASKPKTMTDRQKVVTKSMKANPNAELAAVSRGVAVKNQARRNASEAAISSVKSQRAAKMKQLEIKRMRDKLKGK